MQQNKVLILGKLPPPFFGPAIATEIILKSSLKENYDLNHFDTRINFEIGSIGENQIGKFFLALKSYIRFLKKIRTIRPELVLIPISQSTIGFMKDSIYILLGLKYSKKVLVHLRGGNLLTWLESSSNLTNWYFKKIINKTSGAIVVGHNLKYLFNGFVESEKIHVVPNGGNFVIPLIEKPKDQFKVLCLSNLMPSKGIEDVINAASILRDFESTSIEIILVGAWLDNSYRKNCLDIIRSKNLPVSVYPQATGEIKKKFFSESNLFLFTPREPEGHPWVIIEAMAAGLPIISTDQGAITESVIDGQNGFIVKAKQPLEIAEKITLLAKDTYLCYKMGLESRRLYENKFTEEIMVKNLGTAIEKTLNSKPG